MTDLLNGIEGLSKLFYSGTIALSVRLFWIAWSARQRDKFIRTIFIVYVLLVPLYAAFAIMYVLDISYHSWVGFLGWTTLTTLFLCTDGMLLEYIVRHKGGSNHER